MLIQISWYNKKRGIRYNLMIGKGHSYYGQTSLISLTKEYWDKGKVEFAKILWSFLP